MSEAVPLAHALVTRLAELEGVRILFIKGPTAVALGARPPRPSSDVDVLCEAGGLEKLGPALERCGWRKRVAKSSVHGLEHASKYLFDHSVHYIHDEWPCDIDVHFNFPGFFAPPDVVFEAMWQGRAHVPIANILVPSPNKLAQAAVVGLHGLRQPEAINNYADLEFLRQSLSANKRAGDLLAAFAVETGSSDTLAPLLRDIGAEPRPSPWSSEEMLRRWTLRAQHEGVFTTPWLIELRHTPLGRKPQLIRRALFLPADELYSANLVMPRTGQNTARLHLKRWIRAVRHLRRGIRAARRAEAPQP
ncbi:putative nucleotidyltransferase-like protein [Phycicoccus sp. SLBN-51]|nr:putative nucleotidyltransferase-like protein [Phycicoccus sp. SLBN-51]